MNETNATKKMNKNAKRNSEPPFTPEESRLLERLVRKHESILKDKGKNVRSLMERKGIWMVLSKEFNAEGLNVTRSVGKLQKRWYNQNSFRKNKPSTSIISKFKRTFSDIYPESTENFDAEIKDTTTQNPVKGDNSNDSERLGVNYSVNGNDGFMNIIKEMYIATQNAIQEGITTNDEDHFGTNNSVENNIGLRTVIKEIDMAIKNVVEEVYSGITDDLSVNNSIEENNGFMRIIKETLINRNL